MKLALFAALTLSLPLIGVGSFVSAGQAIPTWLILTTTIVALLVVTHAPEVAGQFPHRLRLEDFNRAARTPSR